MMNGIARVEDRLLGFERSFAVAYVSPFPKIEDLRYGCQTVEKG